VEIKYLNRYQMETWDYIHKQPRASNASNIIININTIKVYRVKRCWIDKLCKYGLRNAITAINTQKSEVRRTLRGNRVGFKQRLVNCLTNLNAINCILLSAVNFIYSLHNIVTTSRTIFYSTLAICPCLYNDYFQKYPI